MFLLIFKRIIFIAFFSCVAAYAATDRYNFETQQDRARFDSLTQELRCLVCQNQSLADSNAPLAEDLRQVIVQKIHQGTSDEAIKTYLTDRYGEFILYHPPVSRNTIFLWSGPFLFLIAGFIFLLRVSRCSR